MILFAAMCLFGAARARTGTTLSVPAEFMRELTPPGTENNFLRPGRILFDEKHGEIYVADPGHSRITIFDKNGTFLYEFPTNEYCGAPIDLAIDSKGFIYVLATTREGRRIFIFDYDGTFIKVFEPSPPGNNKNISIGSIAINDQDKLFALDHLAPRIICFSTDGHLVSEFSLGGSMDKDETQELVFGSISIKDDVLYLPIPSIATVKRFHLNGEPLSSLGYRGSGVGELGFPISVGVTSDNIIAILDKHRFNVVCFSESGQFLGEFGGKGMRAGWFYHPAWLAVGPDNQILIGQTYNNMVQVCRMPQFIVDRHLSIHSDNTYRKVDSPQTTGGRFFQTNTTPDLLSSIPMEPGTKLFYYTFHSVHRQVSALPTNHFQALKEVL